MNSFLFVLAEPSDQQPVLYRSFVAVRAFTFLAFLPTTFHSFVKLTYSVVFGDVRKLVILYRHSSLGRAFLVQ